MKKFIALLLACLMMVSVLAGCGGKTADVAEDPADRVLQLKINSALTSADWQASTLTTDMEITWEHVFQGLYDIDEAKGGYVPCLAKDIQVSEDGLTYTITLQDAKFQNGDELKASDVVFSYESAMQNSRFNHVTSFIASIEAQDDKTVVMTLDYPFSAISHTFWTVKIFSQREYEEIIAKGEEFGTRPHTAGTGPYIITEFNPEGVTLEAFEDYWGGAPEIKHVHYRIISEDAAALIAFENNELDYYKDVPTTDWEGIVAHAGEDHTKMVKANDIQWLAVNYKSPTNNNILGNAKVREAIAWAINKQDLVQVCTSGLGFPAYEYMAHEYVATSPNYEDGTFNVYDQNLDKAHECLLEAGFSEEEIAAGIDVGTILTYGSDTAHKGKACVVIQSNLAEAGMLAQVETGDYSVVGPRMYDQDYDMCIFGDSSNYDFNNIRQQVHSESYGMYVVSYKDDANTFDWQKMEELVDAGVATADVAERYQIYTELWKMVMDTNTDLPLYHKASCTAWSSRVVVPSVNPTWYHLEQFSWAE